MKRKDISLRGMVYASMFGAATAAGAYVIIPVPPVPITLQTLFSGLAGALLGGPLGALSQVVYVILGSMGLPVFAGGKAGLGVLFGPTGGYLIGFILGAYVTGRLTEMRKKAGFAWIAFAVAAGFVVLYACGVLQLSFIARLSVTKAVSVGMVPFLIGDAVKVLAAAVITLKVRNRVKV